MLKDAGLLLYFLKGKRCDVRTYCLELLITVLQCNFNLRVHKRVLMWQKNLYSKISFT